MWGFPAWFCLNPLPLLLCVRVNTVERVKGTEKKEHEGGKGRNIKERLYSWLSLLVWYSTSFPFFLLLVLFCLYEFSSVVQVCHAIQSLLFYTNASVIQYSLDFTMTYQIDLSFDCFVDLPVSMIISISVLLRLSCQSYWIMSYLCMRSSPVWNHLHIVWVCVAFDLSSWSSYGSRSYICVIRLGTLGCLIAYWSNHAWSLLIWVEQLIDITEYVIVESYKTFCS